MDCIAHSYPNLGALAQRRGDYQEAAGYYQRSLGMSELAGDQAGMATSHHNLAILAHSGADYQEAARQYHRSLEIRERIGDQGGMADGYVRLGILAHDRGDDQGAARQYQRAFEIAERIGDLARMAASIHQLATLAQSRGTTTTRPANTSEALTSGERAGSQVGMAASHDRLGTLAQSRGNYDDAAREHQLALDIRQRLDDQEGMADSYHQLGTLAYWRGNHVEAARQYQRALDIFERLGDQAGMARTYSNLRNLEARSGEIATAMAWYVRALAIRLALHVRHPATDVRHLRDYRRELGTGQFSRVLNSISEDPDLAAAIAALIDQLGEIEHGTDSLRRGRRVPSRRHFTARLRYVKTGRRARKVQRQPLRTTAQPPTAAPSGHWRSPRWARPPHDADDGSPPSPPFSASSDLRRGSTFGVPLGARVFHRRRHSSRPRPATTAHSPKSASAMAFAVLLIAGAALHRLVDGSSRYERCTP
jgi:tetratricopeptide (TPR) repeat protein